MTSWRSSAAYRIAFLNFGAFAVGLAVLGPVVFWAMHIAFTNQLDSMLAEEAQTLVQEYQREGELSDAIAGREASGSTDRLYYGVFAADGRRLYGSLQAKRPGLGVHDIRFVDENGVPDMARGFATDFAPGRRLVVAADHDWIGRIDDTVIAVFAFAFLGACILAFYGALLLGSYLRKRLQSISGAAESIIRGDIRGRMPVTERFDEFDALAATLNRMLDRIEGLVDSLRQVSSDIAHDLRTPLARLRNRLEDGLRDGGAPETAAEVIEDSISRVDEVLSLFAAILRISEVESGETRRFFKPVDMSALAGELADSYAPAIADGGRHLSWSVEPGLAVVGDRELLAQAAINLLENAQRHTPAGTMIRLTLVGIGSRVCLRVVDNGPGVSPADRHRIVKRFARLDSSRNVGGFGLGLSLVVAVAGLHGGRLVLADGRPGLAATIEIPRAAADRHETAAAD